MAAYAHTVTLLTRYAIRLGPLKILIGKLNVTNYHATNVAVTGISGAFGGAFTVVFDTSDTGNLFEWTGTSAKVWKGAAGANDEAANDSDVGEANFVAIGVA